MSATLSVLWSSVVVLTGTLITVACSGGSSTPTSSGAASQSPSGTRSPTPPTAALIVGPESAWSPGQSGIRALLTRCPEADMGRTTPSLECVKAVMQEAGASAEAIDFYRQTGLVLAEFRKLDGPVDFAMLLSPWKGVEYNNWPAFIIRGVPPIVGPRLRGFSKPDTTGFLIKEVEAGPLKEIDAPGPLKDQYSSLAQSFPNLITHGDPPSLESASKSDNGGEEFVFQFDLADGCFACATGYFARVAYEFPSADQIVSADFGNSQRLIGLCSRRDSGFPWQAPKTPVTVTLPTCPRTDLDSVLSTASPISSSSP